MLPKSVQKAIEALLGCTGKSEPALLLQQLAAAHSKNIVHVTIRTRGISNRITDLGIAALSSIRDFRHN